MMASTSLSNKITCSVPEALEAYNECKFIDGSWFLKGRNARQEYEDGPRIAGAQYFDIDDIADKSQPGNLMHMMPPKQLFAAAMDAMDITNDDHIVVYCSKGCPMVHRSWFQIRGMGHEKITLMQGNLDDWKDLGGPIEEGPKKALDAAKDLDLSLPTRYQASDPQQIVNLQEMQEFVQQQEEQTDEVPLIIDVRGRDRFFGTVEEPRPGMRRGHMPGAMNIPFFDLLNPDDPTRLKDLSELKTIVQDAGLNDVGMSRPIVVSCGSGATACALVLTLELLGRDPKATKVYDGSWSEWGALPDTAIVT